MLRSTPRANPSRLTDRCELRFGLRFDQTLLNMRTNSLLTIQVYYLRGGGPMAIQVPAQFPD
jgi:hypothetical protein